MSITTMTFAARGFSARRGASDEHTLQGSVRSEQRSLVEKELPPGGLRRIWPVAALLVGYRSTAGYAPSSRLATGQIGRNERHRIYVHDHLAIIVNPALTPPATKSAAERARFIRDQLPQSGFFADMDWRISPIPFALGADLAIEL